MPDLTFPQFFTYVIAPILAGIGGIWAFYARVLTPARLQRERKTQEHWQETETGAFKQILKLNESLVTVLIDINNRDKFKLEEMLSDLELELNTIKVELNVIKEQQAKIVSHLE